MRPDRRRDPRRLAAVRRIPRARRRLHRNHPADDRRDLFRRGAGARPTGVVANAYGTINALSIAGTQGRWPALGDVLVLRRRPWRAPEGDGLNHGNAPISTATIPPLEILEAAYPVMFRQWALRPDSAGAGAHRGGLGAIYEIELLEKRRRGVPVRRARAVRAQGRRGRRRGGAEPCSPIEQDDGWHTPPMVSKMVGIKLKRASAVRLETPGGGGYGPASDRDPDAVARDVRAGLSQRRQRHATCTAPAWRSRAA